MKPSKFPSESEYLLNHLVQRKFHNDPKNIHWVFSLTNDIKYIYMENILAWNKIKLKENIPNSLPSGSTQNWTGYGLDNPGGKIYLLQIYNTLHELVGYGSKADPGNLEENKSKPDPGNLEENKSKPDPGNLEVIINALKIFKEDYKIEDKTNWHEQFYHYVNRIYYLDFLNKNKEKFEFYLILMFRYKGTDRDLKNGIPHSKYEWKGALNIVKDYLGIINKYKQNCLKPLSNRMVEVFIDLDEL